MLVNLFATVLTLNYLKMYKNKFAANLILLLYLGVVVSCSGNKAKTEKAESQMEASLIEVSIGGMTCTGCEQTIQKT